jgi:hypothetical protein
MFVSRFSATARAVYRVYLPEQVSDVMTATDTLGVESFSIIIRSLVCLKARRRAYVIGFDVAALVTS